MSRNTSDYPHRVAVIDVGSNSAKMVCYSATRTGAYRPYNRESFKLRLDEYGDGTVNPKQTDRLLDILMLFQNTIQYEKVDRVSAVATSAIRSAKNRDHIIDTVKDRTGLPFCILSGEQEALYSYVGAATHLDIPDLVFFDIGGGSVEFVFARNHTILGAISLPIGSLVMTRRFAGSGDFDDATIVRLRDHLRDTLPTPDSMGQLRNAQLVGTGGTLRAISRYAQSYMPYPLKKIHNYTMDSRLIQDVTTDILSQSGPALAGMYEIGTGRADIIKAGAVIISEIAERFGSRLLVSSTGLREGVLARSVYYPELAMDEISPYHAREMVRAPAWMPHIPVGASQIVQSILSSGLLRGEEPVILQAAATNLGWLRTFRDADDFLYRILDEPSSLTHRVQLLSALCLAHTRKPKRTRLLMRRYGTLLHADDHTLIRRLSPILLLCDTIITADASTHITLEGQPAYLDVKSNGRTLPHAILQQRCRLVGEALGIEVTAR